MHPQPYCLPSTHSPSYTFLETYVNLPCPCFFPYLQSPSYSDPFGQVNLPLPWNSPLSHCPSQIDSFGYLQIPQFSGWKVLRFMYPSYCRPSLNQMLALKAGQLLRITVYYLLQSSGWWTVSLPVVGCESLLTTPSQQKTFYLKILTCPSTFPWLNSPSQQTLFLRSLRNPFP